MGELDLPIVTAPPESIWIWSDLHLSDRASLAAWSQPFRNTDEMNHHLLREWSRQVRTRDTIICRGMSPIPTRGTTTAPFSTCAAVPEERLLVLGRTPAGPCRTTRESPLRVRSRSGRLQPAAGDAGTRTASARSSCGEVEPTEGLADPPQAPLDHSAGFRDALGSLICRVRAARVAESFRRDLVPAQCRDLALGGFQIRNHRPFERLDQRVDGLQQAIDARLPAQLSERSADVFGDGSAVVLQVHDRHRARRTAPSFSDVALVAFVAGVVLCGRVVGAARVVLKEQVDRLGGPRWTPKSGQYDQLDILAGFGCPPRLSGGARSLTRSTANAASWWSSPRMAKPSISKPQPRAPTYFLQPTVARECSSASAKIPSPPLPRTCGGRDCAWSTPGVTNIRTAATPARSICDLPIRRDSR